MESLKKTLPENLSSDKTGKYLTFSLSKEGYGIPVIKVQEIIQMQKITPLPKMPEHIRGIINLRGRIIPVIDLKIKFKMNLEQVSSSCIVVVDVKDKDALVHQVGVVVDSVEEVISISGEDIENAPEIGNSLNTNYIIGMAKIKGEVKMLIEIDKLISSDIDSVDKENFS